MTTETFLKQMAAGLAKAGLYQSETPGVPSRVEPLPKVRPPAYQPPPHPGRKILPPPTPAKVIPLAPATAGEYDLAEVARAVFREPGTPKPAGGVARAAETPAKPAFTVTIKSDDSPAAVAPGQTVNDWLIAEWTRLSNGRRPELPGKVGPATAAHVPTSGRAVGKVITTAAELEALYGPIPGRATACFVEHGRQRACAVVA